MSEPPAGRSNVIILLGTQKTPGGRRADQRRLPLAADNREQSAPLQMAALALSDCAAEALHLD